MKEFSIVSLSALYKALFASVIKQISGILIITCRMSAGKPLLATLAPEQFGWKKRANVLQPVYVSDDKAVVPDRLKFL